jgi:5'-nucleotidase (lipoprotein e(P4) family)
MRRIGVFLLLSVCFCFQSLGQVVQDEVQVSSNKLLPVIWQQLSAEYRALCYQAYNFASWKLDTVKMKGNVQYAIITDIDETILDNSYYEADIIRKNVEYKSNSWKEWTRKGEATPVPGSLEFFKKAKAKGFSIFYISNRDTSEVQGTMANLKKFDFPDVDQDHMLFLSNSSSKEERRLSVMKKYNVVMLFGDNLNDFTYLFEKKPNINRLEEADKIKNEWGNRFIVLPNAMYGEWENAAYDYDKKLNNHQKNKKLVEKLVGSE